MKRVCDVVCTKKQQWCCRAASHCPAPNGTTGRLFLMRAMPLTATRTTRCGQAIDPVSVAVHPCRRPSRRILCWSTAVLVNVLERGGCIPCVNKCLQILPCCELCTPIHNCAEQVFPGLATLWCCCQNGEQHQRCDTLEQQQRHQMQTNVGERCKHEVYQSKSLAPNHPPFGVDVFVATSFLSLPGEILCALYLR